MHPPSAECCWSLLSSSAFQHLCFQDLAPSSCGTQLSWPRLLPVFSVSQVLTLIPEGSDPGPDGEAKSTQIWD